MISASDNLKALREELQQLQGRISKFSLFAFFILFLLFTTISSSYHLIKNDEIDFAFKEVFALDKEVRRDLEILQFRKVNTNEIPRPSLNIPDAIYFFQEQPDESSEATAN